ncbi:S8 family peptidase [Agarilytica rhodophyticola]|uniref:S8 family peptidase n=1 Tax=Agarilytica rhodophyticola TaxID=1737490 RepID=UPI0013151560|nr:S8 family serine peptidase [Agarilytica rhodophyticola]
MLFKICKKILPAAAICCTVLQTHDAHAINDQVEKKKFNSERKTNKTVRSTREYFVRLNVLPLIPWTKNHEKNAAIVTSQRKVEYANQLKKLVADKMAEFESQGLETSDAVVLTDVGFSVYAKEDEILSLSKNPGIKSIIAKQKVKFYRDHSTSWVGGDRAHATGITGKGQVIAIIDSGLDYTHKDFSGDGSYLNNDPNILEPDSFPTQRVIAGYDFVGDVKGDEGPKPDQDPMDFDGHGTHVAGIAAGNGIEGIIAPGIAPGASLMGYKVGSDNEDSDTDEGFFNKVANAIELAIDPNQDGDMSDSADVINLSLGEPFGDLFGPATVAIKNAVDSGVSVVLAAGNSGNNVRYDISNIGVAVEDSIVVASSVPGNVPKMFVPLISDSGKRFEFFATYADKTLAPALDKIIVGDITMAIPFDGCSKLKNSLTNKIAMISADTKNCQLNVKLRHALQAKADAVVFASTLSNLPQELEGDSVVKIPTLMISSQDASLLINELGSNKVRAELAKTNVKLYEADDNIISDFSSRGPGATGLFKPDISAPGFNINSTRARSGDKTEVLSGTSMASPQVAGMVALLKEKFPNLKPSAIKAIIQNTSTPAKVLNVPEASPPLSLQGTGVINIEKALQASSYAYPGGIGFGFVNPEYNASATRYLTITNMSDTGKRYTIHHEPNQTLPGDVVSISINNEVYVSAGSTQKIPVNLHINAHGIQNIMRNEVDGWFVINSGDEVMRVGYMAVIRAASRLNFSQHGDIVTLRNDAFGDAIAYPYTLSLTQDKNVEDVNSIKSIGFHSISDQAILIGVNASNDWASFGTKALDMLIDHDEDGNDDFLVSVAHLSYFGEEGNDFAVKVEDLVTENEFFFSPAYPAFNNSIIRFAIPQDFMKKGDTSFNYRIRIRDRSVLNEEGFVGGKIDLTKQVKFAEPSITIKPQQAASIKVSGSGESLWLTPTEKKGRRSLVR